MVQALDKENHTTILKDMIEQAELKGKYLTRVECWCKKEEIIMSFLDLYSNRH